MSNERLVKLVCEGDVDERDWKNALHLCDVMWLRILGRRERLRAEVSSVLVWLGICDEWNKNGL